MCHIRHMTYIRQVYMVYTVYMSYTWHKPCIWQIYDRYFYGIYLEVGAAVVDMAPFSRNLWRRHRLALSWRHFLYFCAMAPFFFGYVVVDGALGYIESLQSNLLTRSTNIAAVIACQFGRAKWSCLLRRHRPCCSAKQDGQSVNSKEKTLVSNTEFRHMVGVEYTNQVYTTYTALTRPDPSRRGNQGQNSTGPNILLAFIVLLAWFESQRHFLILP